MVGNMVGLLIVVVLFGAVIGIIVTTTNSLTTGATPVLSGSSNTLASQIPLFIVIAVVLFIIGIALAGWVGRSSKGR